MKFLFFALGVLVLAIPASRGKPSRGAAAQENRGFLFIANQAEHSALLLDLDSRQVVGKIGVDVNGHEVALAPDHRTGYVPIYGDSGVGRPGSDGSTIHVIDLLTKRTVRIINLGKAVRPHCAQFGPDGLLYVSAELANAIYIVDPASGKLLGEVPTGAVESHMFVLSPDGHRAYTSNVGAGSVSVLDLEKRALVTVIPVARRVQRISISPDGAFLFTHDQDAPRIAVISTASNKLARWIELPSNVYSSAPTPDRRQLLANAPSGKLFVVDLSSNKVTASYPIPPAVGEIALDGRGDFAYISCPQKGTIEVLDVHGGKLEAPIVLSPGVDGLAWFPGPP